MNTEQTDQQQLISESQLRAILDATPFPIALVDVNDDNIEYWSQSALTLFGHTAPTAPEWHLIAYPDPEYRRKVIDRWKLALEVARTTRRTINTGVYQVTCADGSFRMCELYAAFLSDKLIVTFNDITGRIQAEDDLKKSEMLFREVINSMEKAIAIYEPVANGEDFRFVEMNEFGERITHFKIAEVIGKTIKELFSEESSIGLISKLRETWETGNSTQIPLKQYVDERITQWVENYIFRLPSGLVVAMFEDTFEKRKTELAIMESEARFRQFFENNAEFCCIISPEGTLIDINHHALDVLGYAKDEIVGKPMVTTIYAPESQEKAYEAFITWQQTGNLRNVELTILTKSGEERTVLLYASVVKDTTGHIIYSTSIQTDITERKQAIAEAEMLAKFPSENPNPVLRIAQDGAVLYYNSASIPLLKTWCFIEGEPLPDRCLWSVRESLAEAAVKTEDLEIDDKVLSLTFAPIVDSGFVNVYGLDITAQKRATEALWEYSERLEEMVAERTRDLEAVQERLIRQERLAVLGELAGGVGHELRNPLGVITNAIYYLKMILPGADAEIQEYLGLIDAEATNAAKIVSDLLDFARIKSSDLQPTRVQTLIASSLAKSPCPEGIVVDVQGPGDMPQVWIDPQQLTLVFNNLITNAYQAMPDGGEVTITCGQDVDSHGESQEGQPETQRWVWVSVGDTGTGITPENMGKLFEPLFTTKFKGIGLGLATSKNLVEANGGSIEVESQWGVGTVFTVFLPVSSLPGS